MIASQKYPSRGVEVIVSESNSDLPIAQLLSCIATKRACICPFRVSIIMDVELSPPCNHLGSRSALTTLLTAVSLATLSIISW